MSGSKSIGGYEDVDVMVGLVVLEGGPVELPSEAAERAVGDGERIKVPFRGGYEHFERVDEAADGPASPPRVVYRWVRRTAVAE